MGGHHYGQTTTTTVITAYILLRFRESYLIYFPLLTSKKVVIQTEPQNQQVTWPTGIWSRKMNLIDEEEQLMEN